MIAFVGFCQQDHVVEALLAFTLEFFIGRKVDLATKDGLYHLPCFGFERLAGIFQFGNATHNAMVRNGHGGHAQFSGACHHFVDACCAVEQGIFGVIV